jgi:hypothetical protein
LLPLALLPLVPTAAAIDLGLQLLQQLAQRLGRALWG